MVFNIQLQLCGLVLVIMVMSLFFTKKTLRLLTEKIYSHLLVAVFLCVSLDILSIIAINLKDRIPGLLINIVCKSYLFSISVVAYLILAYTLLDIYKRYTVIKKQLKAYALLMVLAAVLCMVLPISYYLDGKSIYSYGPSVMAIYAIVIIYLTGSVYCVIHYWKRMNPQRRSSVIFLLVSWIVTAGIQFLHNKWLLVGFAMCIAMVYMYLCLENPDENIDKLTGVFNSYGFDLYLANLFDENRTFKLITVSFDDLKFINETFGIKNGNILLEKVADYLSKSTGGKIFRSGGDEFSIILEEDKDCENMAEIIQKRFQSPWKIAGADLNLSICMLEMQGKEFVSSSEGIIELIKYFMLEAKRQGKGKYIHIGKEEIQKRNEKNQVEYALRRAMEKGEIQVYYQPICSNREGRYVSAEALVRIQDEQGQFVSPELFIPIAEQNGLILELGLIVFEKVCSFIKEKELWKQGIHYVEVNLSVIQCMQDSLAAELFAVMKKYNIPPSFINLEITETAAVNSENTLQHNMNTLIKEGATFSLDDYGTGYSNLSYIVGLPVELIKLDKTLVWSYFQKEKARIVMESSIVMIRHLGMRIVAEGIETEEQFEKMKELGIDYIQGYYLSRPLPEAAFLKELAAKMG